MAVTHRQSSYFQHQINALRIPTTNYLNSLSNRCQLYLVPIVLPNDIVIRRYQRTDQLHTKCECYSGNKQRYLPKININHQHDRRNRTQPIGFICDFHPTTLGSNPKGTVSAFSEFIDLFSSSLEFVLKSSKRELKKFKINENWPRSV